MRVFSNLAVSVDGKIADRRHPKKMLGTPADKAMMEKLRRQSDVIVFGANTLRAYPRALRINASKGKKAHAPVNAVITSSGDIDPTLPFWDAEDVIRFVFTTSRGFDKALASAKDRAFVVDAGESSVDARRVLERLKRSDLKNVLVEGGGEIMALFLGANLMQELHVTLTPWILGGKANPSLVGGDGLPEWAKLEIAQMKKVKNEVYFKFKVKGADRV